MLNPSSFLQRVANARCSFFVVALMLTAMISCSRSQGNSTAPNGAGAASNASGWGPASEDPSVVNVVAAVFDPNSKASDNVINECAIQTKIPQFIQNYAQTAVNLSEQDSQAGQTLKIRVTYVLGFGGGIYSGPKSMTVEGILYRGSERVAGFKARRTTTGGMYGGFKGTCSLLGRCTKTLGKDIAAWLVRPVDGAQLGEL